ncbi:hypothetical protein FACS1894202_13170 [Clostridia bacterium]|nr:hypothetical protein FACS1894202_13170 [Clostridia bacterium]
MDKPIGEIIIIGVVTVIIAAAIAIGFGLFSTSKGTANDGVVQVQQQIGEMNNAIFSDYDQKTLAGSQVTAAYNQLKGKPYAVVVKTCKGKWVNYNSLISPFTATTHVQATIPFKGLTLDASSKQINSSESYLSQTSASVAIALVLSDGGGDDSKKMVLYNNVTTEMYKNGTLNYVAPSATFNSFLIRDAGDEVVGVVFIQQGKHV